MKRRSLPLIAVLSIVGCDDATAPSPQVDSAVVQDLIEELIAESMSSLGFATLNTEGGAGPRLGFALQLLGVSEGLLGSASIFPGAPSGTFDPFCDSQAEPQTGFWEGLDTCRRLTKHGLPMYDVDVYFTVQPITAPNDPHPFSYEGAEVAGTFTYDPNPLITWNHDFSDEVAAFISSTVNIAVTYEAPDGAVLDLSHAGRLVGQLHSTLGPLFSLDLNLAPNPLCEQPLRVSVEDEDDVVTGSVLCGTDELASIGHDDTEFTFEWQDE